MRLYDISESILAILGEESDDLANDAEQRLGELSMEFDQKAEAILKYRQGLAAEATAIGHEIERLCEIGVALEKKADRLKEILFREMKRLNLKRVSTLTFNATVAKSPPKIEVDNVDVLPDRFVRTTKEPKKADLIEAMKNDAAIQAVALAWGIRIIEGEHLRIT